MKIFSRKTNDRPRKQNTTDSHGGKRQMYQAICASCGKACEVPFKPTTNRPIFCQECFTRRKNSKPGAQSKKQTFEAVCVGCGKKFQLPFRPRGDRPVYCNDCLKKTVKPAPSQFEVINAKLDQILEVLSAKSAPKTTNEKKNKKVKNEARKAKGKKKK